MNSKFSDFRCLRLFVEHAETEAPLVSTLVYAEWRGTFCTS